MHSLTARTALLTLAALAIALFAAWLWAWPLAAATDPETCEPDAGQMVKEMLVGESCTIGVEAGPRLTHKRPAEREIVSLQHGDADSYDRGGSGFSDGTEFVELDSATTVTVTARSPGEAIVGREGKTWRFRVTNEQGGIYQGVCEETSFLLRGDVCLLPAEPGDRFVHQSADDKDVASLVKRNNNVALQAHGLGTITLTRKRSGEDDLDYKITVMSEPEFEIVFENDSDGIVQAGAILNVGIRSKGVVRGDGAATGYSDTTGWRFDTAAGTFGDYEVALSVPSSGLVFGRAVDRYAASSGDWAGRKQWDPALDRGFGATSQLFRLRMIDAGLSGALHLSRDNTDNQRWYLLTDGVPASEYTITATVLGTDLRPDKVGHLYVAHKVTKTLTITEDAGKPVSSATLSLAEDEQETESANTQVRLEMKVTNSLGNPANDAEVSDVIVFAPGGKIDDEADVKHFRGKEALATTAFTVTKTQPGTVDVRVTVIGAGESLTTETLVLTFTGGPAKISLTATSESRVSAGDDIEFEVMLFDEFGYELGLDLDKLSVLVTDPAGETTEDVVVTREQQDASGQNGGRVRVAVATSSEQAPGTYTAEVTVAGQPSTKQTAEFALSGVATQGEISLDKTELSISETVTATVRLTDKAGNLVANGTPVTFSTAGALQLLGLAANADGVVVMKTKDGVATARFVAAAGSGVGFILVSQGAQAIGVVQVNTAAPPETAPGLHCLSAQSGLATWTCDTPTTAAEVFNLVSARGASAVLLWDGSAWLRYAGANGTPESRSSDFAVSRADAIFISN